MKIKCSCGSALLLVFIVSFVLSLSALRCWRLSSLMCDIQYQRELFYKRFYITRRIFNAGVDLTCKKFDSFLKLKKPISVDVNFCLTDVELNNANVAHMTVLKFGKVADCVLISVSLLQKNEVVCNMRCLLKRAAPVKTVPALAVRDHTVNAEKKYAKEKRIYFVVNNFTLSSAL